MPRRMSRVPPRSEYEGAAFIINGNKDENISLVREQTFSTWDLRPFTAESGFVVAVLGLA